MGGNKRGKPFVCLHSINVTGLKTVHNVMPLFLGSCCMTGSLKRKGLRWVGTPL